MNFTCPSLECYTSYSEFTDAIVDYGNVFILTFTSLFGLITNLLCIIIIGFLDKKDFMNKFSLAYSLLNFEFHLINVFIGLIRCGSLCSYGFSYGSKVYELYFYLIGQNIILLTCILLDLGISLNRLASFKNKTSMFLIIKKDNFSYVFLCIFLASVLIVSTCYVIPRQVNQFGWLLNENDFNIGNQTTMGKALYQVTANDIGKNDKMIIFLLVLNIFRGVVLLVILFVLNVVIGYKYHRHIKIKKLKFSNIRSNYFDN
jgi:hypothetical protein